MLEEVAPQTIVSPDGVARHGAYHGALGAVTLEGLRDARLANPVWRLTHRKRWMYVLLADDQLLCAAAVIHLGYASSCFAFVLDRRTRTLLFDRSVTGLPLRAHVGVSCEAGCDVRFRAGGLSASFRRPETGGPYTILVQASGAHGRGLNLRACLELGTHEPIAVVAPVSEAVVNVTEKRVLMPASAEVLVGDRFFRLESALAGFDYTHGFLARRTSWRWAFGVGHSSQGALIALNLVEGFNNQGECAVWLGNKLVPVSGVRFGFEPDRPLAPWTLRSEDGAVQLRFVPDALHEERRNLGVVWSDFVQPAGSFSGTLTLPGHSTVHLDALPGVVESQDVLW